MRIYLENGELAEITVKQGKNEHIYEYYIGSIKIGVLNDKIMENNILILEDSIKEPKIAEEIKEKQELQEYQESVTFEKKPSLWQKIKNSKLGRAVSYVLKIRIRIELPDALPEGRGEE